MLGTVKPGLWVLWAILWLGVSAGAQADNGLFGPRIIITPMQGVTTIDEALQWSDPDGSAAGYEHVPWLRLSLKDGAELKEQDYHLIFPRGQTRQFRIYQPPLYQPEMVHYRERSMDRISNLYVLELPLDGRGFSRAPVYLEVVEGLAPSFAQVWTEEQFFDIAGPAEALIVAMRSLMFFTIFFSLFLWIKLRTRVFLAYSAFITFSFLLYFSYTDGWNYHFSNLDIPSHAMPVIYSGVGTACYFFALQFVSLYAQFDRYVRGVGPYVRFLKVLLLLIIAALLVTGGHDILVVLANLIWLLVGISIWIMSLVAWRRGSRYAVYVIIGWTPFILVAQDMLAVAAGWKYGNSLNFMLFDAAVIFELVVFQFGLADMVLSFREERDKAAQLAQRDALSGAYNRHGFKQIMPGKVEDAKKNGSNMTVALFDIDHFKAINDRHGHDVGDLCIQAVTTTIQEQLRESDLLVRYGGEEFLVVLPNISLQEAGEVCQRIRSAIRTSRVQLEDQEIRFTTSAGLAEVDLERPVDVSIKKADEALYVSKQGGRDTMTMA